MAAPFIFCLEYSTSGCTTACMTGDTAQCAIYQFQNCCDPSYIFRITNVGTILNVGTVYSGSASFFSGCSEVIVNIGEGPIFDASSLSLVGPFSGCSECVICPTPVPTATPTPSPTPCTVPEYCLTSNFNSFSAFTGNYFNAGIFNGFAYFTGDTISPSFLFFNGSTWCLSSTLGGSCILVGSTCVGVCPDLPMLFPGACLPTPTPFSCSTFDFSAFFQCQDPTPTPTASSTPTPTPTTSPTPTPTVDNCPNVGISLSATTTGSGETESFSLIEALPETIDVAGTVTFSMSSNSFDCPFTNKLIDCLTFDEYYVEANLSSGSTAIPSGSTISAYINGVLKCVTFVSTAPVSTNAILNKVVQIFSACTDCEITVPPTATPVPTATPTPTSTPTSTPTPTPFVENTFIYVSCSGTTGQSKILAQLLSGDGELIGQTTNYNGTCWTLTAILEGWQPTYPADIIYFGDFFSGSTIIGPYDNCEDCITGVYNDISLGNTYLITPQYSAYTQIPSSSYTLSINGEVLTDSTPVLVGSYPVIETSDILNFQIINPVFVTLQIVSVLDNTVLLSTSMNSSSDFIFNSFTMVQEDVRIDVYINADFYITI